MANGNATRQRKVYRYAIVVSSLTHTQQDPTVVGAGVKWRTLRALVMIKLKITYNEQAVNFRKGWTTTRDR